MNSTHHTCRALLMAAMIGATLQSFAADNKASQDKGKPPPDQTAVICMQGNCMHVRSNVARMEPEARPRRGPLWFLEEIFFN